MKKERLPVQKFSPAEALKLIREHNAKVPAMVAQSFGEDAVPVLSQLYLVDEDQVFVWRVRLGCGCLSVASTQGDDPAPLARKSQECFNHYPTYRAVTGWGDRRLVCKTGIEYDLYELPEVAAKVRGEEHAVWTATLECGHRQDDVETDADFDPATGPRLITKAGIRRAGAHYLANIKKESDPVEREHLQRMWDLGQPHPEPEMCCLPCAHAEPPVVAYWPDGWLKPRKPPRKTAAPRQPDRADLERRLRKAEADAEILRAALRNAT